MAKPKSDIEKIRLTITTTPKIIQFLDVLLETEIFGTTRAEVAENVIKRTMQQYKELDTITKLKQEL